VEHTNTGQSIPNIIAEQTELLALTLEHSWIFEFTWASFGFPLLSYYDNYYLFLDFTVSVGLSFLQFTNMNSMRNLLITSVSPLFLGMSIPEHFREYTIKALHGPAHSKLDGRVLLFYQSYVSTLCSISILISYQSFGK